jgi:hypothetical protein
MGLCSRVNPDSTLPLESGQSKVFSNVLRFLTGYFVVSMLTLPFIGRLWFGEVPLLAIIQLPKTVFAIWLRKGIVMQAIVELGLSKGSFSPDYILARPYALAIVYLIPMIIVAFFSWHRLKKFQVPPSRPEILFFAVAVLDYVLTLVFGQSRGLTIY